MTELGSFFRPRNVALVGASDKSAWSAIVHSRFAMWRHEGQLFAVNRQGLPAHGIPGYRSCRDIPGPVDMAYIYVPSAAVGDAIRDAAAKEIRHAVVLSSGFAEVGSEGDVLQEEVLAAARAANMRLLGPNSLGFANVGARAVTTSISTRQPIHPGRIAIVAQSGAIAQEIYNFAQSQGVGIGFIAASGNEADINMADIVDYLIDDPDTGAVVLYAESIKDPARFLAAAMRAFEAAKPIVMIKLGRSDISAAVAKAHTGSLIGDDRVFDAMCHRYGIVRVASIEEMVLTARLLESVGPISPPRVAMVSLSGGACAVYADLASQHGLTVAPFAPETKSALRDALPAFASTLNPLDVTGAVVNDRAVWSRVLPALVDDPGTGLVVTSTVVPSTAEEVIGLRGDIDAMVEGYRVARRKPVLMAISLDVMTEARRAFLAEIGADSFIPNLDVGVRSLAHLERWSERLQAGAVRATPPPARSTERPVGERQTLGFLAGHGVPVIPAQLAQSADAAAAIADEIGGSVVLKVASPDIAHKTEAGGVRLGLAGREAVADAFNAIMAAAHAYAPAATIDGVIVSPMRQPATELIVGVARDPEWGLVLAVGFGGTAAEILGDSVVRLMPVSTAEVREMLLSLRMSKLLQGFRGSPPADLDTLAAAIVAISEAAVALGPSLAALEVNPLRVHGSAIEALDALTVYADQ